MSDFFTSWDATNEERMGNFSPVPEDKYLAMITDGEWKPTKAGTGEYLQLTFEIIQHPDYAGRKVWARLNLKNPNSETVRIAKQELSSICHAVGVLKPAGIPALCNTPLLIGVKCKKRQDNGELTNEIKGYAPKPRLAPAPAKPPVVAAAAQPQEEPAPWA